MYKFLLIFLILIFLIGFSYFIYQGIYLPKDFFSEEEIFFSIEKGQGVKEIAFNLKEQGIIKSDYIFLFYSLIRGNIRNLQSGDYSLSSSMSVLEVLNKLSRGDVIKEKIIIIEGWNLNDINLYLQDKEVFGSENFFSLAGFPLGENFNIWKESIEKFKQEFTFLEDKPQYANLEGYLFPDTYEITSKDNTESIIKKILSNFNEKINPEIKEEIKNQGKTIFEIITMASLIEKEVRTFEDKKIVSGILWKRLVVGMPLQVDATINYITGRKDAGVLIIETKVDSFYNTYKYKGLPLGPISNPGIESIKAALFPKDSDYWYYLSTKDGETIFSENFEKHKISKEKYLK